MSVALTEQAVVEHRKTVTRRLGWDFLKPGDELELCRKVMGRKRRDGSVEPLVRLCRVRVVSVSREPLINIDDADVTREGFTPMDLAPFNGGSLHYEPEAFAWAFVRFFCASMKCTPSDLVNRIEWEYL